LKTKESCTTTDDLPVQEAAALLQDQMGEAYFLQFSGLCFSYNPDNAVLFTVPFIDQNIPATRAVLEAELFSGEGVQVEGDGAYVHLEWGDEELYRVVTDTYILSFLPVTGDLLPRLEITPKDADGKPPEGAQMNCLFQYHPFLLIGREDHLAELNIKNILSIQDALAQGKRFLLL